MTAPFPSNAPRTFCVTIQGDDVRYRQVGARHATDRDAASTGDHSASGVGIGHEVPCDQEGVETSSSAVLAELDRAHRRREIAPWVPLGAVLVVYFATIGALGARAPVLGVVAVFAGALGAMTAVYLLLRRTDRARGTADVFYHLDGEALARYVRLQQGLRRLAACNRVWHVPTEGRAVEGHRKYGAKLFLRRYRIRPALARPMRIGSNVRVPTLYGERRKFFFFPDRVLVFDENGVHALAYAALGMHAGQALCIEDEDVPFDARTVDSTWLHLKADGTPDPRIANNRRFPIVLYGELEFAGPGGVRELFLFSQPGAADDLLAAVERIAWGDEEDEEEVAAEPGPADAESGPAAPSEAEPSDDAHDELYDEALRAVVRAGYATLELLVHEFGIGYGRAAMIISLMEQEGYVGPAFRNKPRTVNRSAVRYVELAFDANGTGENERRKRAEEREAASRRRSRRHAARGVNGAGAKRPPHVILGVSPNATRDEVTAAYHEMAQMYHPDKVASLAPEFRDLAERRMKEINAAYRDMIKRA